MYDYDHKPTVITFVVGILVLVAIVAMDSKRYLTLPIECITDADCYDENACGTQVCLHTRLLAPGGQCVGCNDGDPCTVDRTGINICLHEVIDNCCTSRDCEDVLVGGDRDGTIIMTCSSCGGDRQYVGRYINCRDFDGDAACEEPVLNEGGDKCLHKTIQIQ